MTLVKHIIEALRLRLPSKLDDNQEIPRNYVVNC